VVQKLTQEQYITQAKAAHGDKYDYSELIFVNTNTKVRVICSIHGPWMARPIDHRRGDGCPACKFHKIAGQKRHSVDRFIEKARVIHGTIYDYSKVQYVNAITKVEIVCAHHGSFFQTPDKHTGSACGCPQCSSRVSKTERYIAALLTEAGIPFETEKTFSDLRGTTAQSILRYDFWIPSKQLLLEYDGEHHTQCVKRSAADTPNQLSTRLERMRINDDKKNEYATRNGYRLVRIPHSEQPTIVNILIDQGVIPEDRYQSLLRNTV